MLPYSKVLDDDTVLKLVQYTKRHIEEKTEEILSGDFRIDPKGYLLEKNEVPLEESIALFQEGIELSQYCNHKLENIQYKVAKIYENGQLKDFLSEE